MNALRREWGAVTFVVTILIGAIAVAISLGVSATHATPVPSAPPCPSYTPYVVTPTPAPTAPSPPPIPTSLVGNSASNRSTRGSLEVVT